ncbi:hypothetical protein Tco_0375121, partial [Tanacetum coccineum]
DQASVFMEMTSVHISSGLVLHQMTSDHNRSELGIHDHSNEPSSSKLVPKVVPLAVKTATSRQELELLFHLHIAMLRTTCAEHVKINPMIQPEPEDLPKNNPKLEIAVLSVFTMKMEILLESDVNSSSVEYDNNVQESYELEQLARNAYKEAEKQQIIAKKVQQQNIVLTKQLESYKEKNPKLYDASCLDDSKIHVNVRDTEDILDDATKSQIKMKKKSQDPIAIEKKQNVWTLDYKKLNALYKDFVPQKEFYAERKYFSSSFISSENSSHASSPSSSSETKPTVAPMPSANPMLVDLNQMENDFKTLFELLQTNFKRESIFYTPPEEIRLTNFCQQKVKPILHKLHLNFEIFQKQFLKDIKEMKDVFVSTENDLSETWKQNELLKDQLLEAKLKHEIECCVLLSYECVDNKMHNEIEKIQRDSIEIQEGMQKRINILENDVQRCQKQSLDFELQLQHEKERRRCESSLKNICETSWISKMEKLESENVSLEFQVQSLIKERENVKTEYQKLFDSIKRTQT